MNLYNKQKITNITVPKLNDEERSVHYAQAASSSRRRHGYHFHKAGDEFNRTLCFLMHDSYMCPHRHIMERAESITCVEGRIGVIYFDDLGAIKNLVCLSPGGQENIIVPPLTWHTYVVLTEVGLTFETMTGVFEPETWKQTPAWGPLEGTEESVRYLTRLKERFVFT